MAGNTGGVELLSISAWTKWNTVRERTEMPTCASLTSVSSSTFSMWDLLPDRCNTVCLICWTNRGKQKHKSRDQLWKAKDLRGCTFVNKNKIRELGKELPLNFSLCETTLETITLEIKYFYLVAFIWRLVCVVPNFVLQETELCNSSLPNPYMMESDIRNHRS